MRRDIEKMILKTLFCFTFTIFLPFISRKVVSDSILDNYCSDINIIFSIHILSHLQLPTLGSGWTMTIKGMVTNQYLPNKLLWTLVDFSTIAPISFQSKYDIFKSFYLQHCISKSFASTHIDFWMSDEWATCYPNMFLGIFRPIDAMTQDMSVSSFVRILLLGPNS